MKTMPSSAASAPAMIFMRVDLPAPFSPTMAWTTPGSMWRSTPASAWTPPYAFRTPRTSTAAVPGAASAWDMDLRACELGEWLEPALAGPEDGVDLGLVGRLHGRPVPARGRRFALDGGVDVGRVDLLDPHVRPPGVLRSAGEA